MAEIYLLRHGETEWNAEGRYQGALDSPLTPHGREQARLASRILSEHGGDSILQAELHVSPLGRARETAAIVAGELRCEAARIEPRLREVSLGSWDGLVDEDIEARWPDAFTGCTRFDWYFKSPDGESYDDAVSRAAAWLGDVKRPVVAVTHGLFSRLLRGVYLNLAREAALRLPCPQGVVWKLADGRVQTFGEAG